MYILFKHYSFYAALRLISLVMRDILREAVFLWITPFVEALAITDLALFSIAATSVPDFSFIANLTLLVALLSLVFMLLLRKRFFSF